MSEKNTKPVGRRGYVALPPVLLDMVTELSPRVIRVALVMAANRSFADDTVELPLSRIALLANLSDTRFVADALTQLAGIGFLRVLREPRSGRANRGRWRLIYRQDGDDKPRSETPTEEPDAGNGDSAGNPGASNGNSAGVLEQESAQNPVVNPGAIPVVNPGAGNAHKEFNNQSSITNGGEGPTLSDKAAAVAAELGIAANLSVRDRPRFEQLVETYGAARVKDAVYAAFNRKPIPIGPGVGLIGWVAARLGGQDAEGSAANTPSKKPTAPVKYGRQFS